MSIRRGLLRFVQRGDGHIQRIRAERSEQRQMGATVAAEIARADFVDQIKQNARKPSPVWIFDTLYWQQILKPQT